MTNPSTPTPEAGWIEWKGGVCPVEGSDVVLVKDRHGLIHGPYAADGWLWGHDGGPCDIFAYRLSDRLADERSEPADPSSSEAKIQALEARVKALEGGLRTRMIQAYLGGAESMAFGCSGHAAIQQKAEGWVYEIMALLDSEGRDGEPPPAKASSF